MAHSVPEKDRAKPIALNGFDIPFGTHSANASILTPTALTSDSALVVYPGHTLAGALSYHVFFHQLLEDIMF